MTINLELKTEEVDTIIQLIKQREYREDKKDFTSMKKTSTSGEKLFVDVRNLEDTIQNQID